MRDANLTVRLLIQYLAENRGKPFAWRENDCCSFALRWAERLTLREGLLPDYEPTAKSARSALREEGGILAVFVSRFGTPLRSPLFAQRGDIAVVDDSGDERDLRAGVVSTNGVYGPGPDGLIAVPIDRAVAAWRI